MRYFFDTYALVEILKNNPNYIKYFEEIITTSKFNLAELYFSLLRDLGEEKAKDGYYRLVYSINNSLKLYEFMYNGCSKDSIALLRKKQVFEKFKNLRLQLQLIGRARPCRLLQLPRKSGVETLWDIGEG